MPWRSGSQRRTGPCRWRVTSTLWSRNWTSVPSAKPTAAPVRPEVAVSTITPITFASIPMIELTVPTQGRLSAYWPCASMLAITVSAGVTSRMASASLPRSNPGPKIDMTPCGRAAAAAPISSEDKRRVAHVSSSVRSKPSRSPPAIRSTSVGSSISLIR